ncbi:NADP-dependent oxidoreductase [Bordetella holmesii]|uniref:Oxidoreductase, zinc-binding dehydrogenase family protein n=2 Tax=Bordetella holmesii TaxID=35814 RepID=A0A158M6P0_9BORD|nr:NADP-dependent oxidoreductase [Bordetella holmesii]AHV92150.1 zinc-binding dehydrogenase family protein [Bordetella holmesii ATCC 51541]AIT28366.1 zinc-binding dehydrogenase family protein [Bordetella holmesii 44057]EWM41155.1 zinc-binding dehydrogenase family protein [Bordetella holmesii 35009]EWM43804.1 zinc-binding dehydrogenase family protein [Bordetella holmesii 41130]EWM45044.1 zinc-binding dehydrogenase family protein [Bordetella holmesii 70147]
MAEQSASVNRRILLARRPRGEPLESDFRLVTEAVPRIGPGQVLLRTVYLSLDPYMRGRMSDAPSYAKPVDLDQVMVGGTVSRVAASQHPDFEVGEWVLGQSGWQDWALSDGHGLLSLGRDPQQPSYALGVLGMPGYTGYMGLLDIGQPQPGETVVVAAATGAVGSVVGQVARLKGCRAVGIAGGLEKCRFAVEQPGFDACLDHHSPDLADMLAEVTPDGIDVYFENVGGKIFDAVMGRLNPRARVPVCGLISTYNATELAPGPDRVPALMGTILRKRIRMQGFIIMQDYPDGFIPFRQVMSRWLEQGDVKYREDRIEGLEAAGRGLIGLLRGENAGKRIVRVGDDA